MWEFGKSFLTNLVRKQEVHDVYDSVIKDQLENNIIEEVTDAEINNSSTEFYMPHREVIRDSAGSTKLRVVYYVSVKSESRFSFNDCLEKGPPKAFSQIKIRGNERDCLKFHWSEKENYDIIKIYRFTRLVFGLNQSPLILEGTLKIHFENYIGMFCELIE